MNKPPQEVMDIFSSWFLVFLFHCLCLMQVHSYILDNGICQFHNHVCAIAKSENFWWDIGQSSLTDRMEDCSTGQSVAV